MSWDIWRDDQWTKDGRFDEKGISYDLNGNILKLSRSYSSSSIIDDLSYTYTGNQLSRLRHSNASGSVNRPSARYSYDANGNMTWDTSKDMFFEYNFLNLLQSTSDINGDGTYYSWLSDGVKARVVDYSGDGYLYLGSLVYRLHAGQSPTLESTGFGAGRIIASESSSGTTYEPHYHVTDHLGSVRVVFTMDSNNNASVVSQNDYYPFGKRHAKPSLVSGGQTRNRFLYNGKEDQTTGNLRLLDYGARMYDPEVGRFFSIDPLTEETPWQSPYAYASNNPIRFIDYLGLSAEETKYVDMKGYLLFETNDGLDDIIVVQDNKIDELEKNLNEMNSKGTIDDPKVNQQELHTLGIPLFDLQKRLFTGDGNYDTAFTEGYREGYYGDKSSFARIVIRTIAAFAAQEGADYKGHVNSGRSIGKRDKKNGYISRTNPRESLKNNDPIIKLEDNK